MTGYASAQQGASATGAEAEGRAPQNRRLGLEIRSVNSRFLDLSFRLPDDLRALEPTLRSLLTARLKRGKVEVRAAIENEDSNTLQDPPARLLQRLNTLQDSVKAWLPGAAPLSVADALRLCANANTSSHDWSEAVPALAEDALTALLSARDRALTEATAFAIRIDVAEEITRLESHLDEIERLLKKGGEVGKRLDFLIQELHREANTLGSKSAALDLTRISVDMKVLIEQMREQVQNIE